MYCTLSWQIVCGKNATPSIHPGIGIYTVDSVALVNVQSSHERAPAVMFEHSEWS